MKLINNYTKSFYLKITPKLLFERLKNEKINRPLISNLPNNKLLKFISINVNNREFFYKKSNIKININNKSIKKITSEIIKIINKN